MKILRERGEVTSAEVAEARVRQGMDRTERCANHIVRAEILNLT